MDFANYEHRLEGDSGKTCLPYRVNRSKKEAALLNIETLHPTPTLHLQHASRRTDCASQADLRFCMKRLVQYLPLTMVMWTAKKKKNTKTTTTIQRSSRPAALLPSSSSHHDNKPASSPSTPAIRLPSPWALWSPGASRESIWNSGPGNRTMFSYYGS